MSMRWRIKGKTFVEPLPKTLLYGQTTVLYVLQTTYRTYYQLRYCSTVVYRIVVQQTTIIILRTFTVDYSTVAHFTLLYYRIVQSYVGLPYGTVLKVDNSTVRQSSLHQLSQQTITTSFLCIEPLHSFEERLQTSHLLALLSIKAKETSIYNPTLSIRAVAQHSTKQSPLPLCFD